MPVLVTVHGTFDADESDAGARWWQAGSDFLKQVDAGLRAEAVAAEVVPFHWSGQNSDFDRFVAARRLHRLLRRLVASGRPVAVLGHSHGGNVIQGAFRDFWPGLMGPSSRCPRAVVSLGTPFITRRRTGLNWLVQIANLTALLYAIPTVAMMLIASLSLFGLMGGAPPGKIGVVPEDVLVAILIPVGIVAIALGVRYGVLASAARLAYRHARSRLGPLWLVLRSPFDEVISVLPRFLAGRYEVITPPAARRAVTRGLQAAITVAIAAVLGGYLYYTFAHAHPGLPSTSYTGVLRYLVPLFYVVFAAMIYVIAYGAAWLAAIPLGVVYAAVLNRIVRRALRASALGEDHDYRLGAVTATPAGLPVIVKVVGSADLGTVTPERRRAASAALLDAVVGTSAAGGLAADPATTWRALNASLYHNAYFDDPETIAATVEHLAARLRQATPHA